MKNIFFLRTFFAFSLCLCFTPLVASVKCPWIHPVNLKYLKTHDIGDSSVLIQMTGHRLEIQQLFDTCKCIFNEREYNKKHIKLQNDIFILPPGVYRFAICAERNSGESEKMNYTLLPGTYYHMKSHIVNRTYMGNTVRLSISLDFLTLTKSNALELLRSKNSTAAWLFIGSSVVILSIVIAAILSI